MAVRPVIRYPDPVFQQTAAPVVVFDAGLADLAQDLLDTMHAAPGIGIAGSHIGVLQRIVVIQLYSEVPAWICVNPRVLWASSELARHDEGSISMPGIREEVERPAKVRVGYQSLAGDERTVEAEGMLAVCFQHEIDQLDGMFWLQRLSRLKRDRAIKRFAKVKAGR